jgi:RNA polymerase sigma factor (sigma-70 family)
VKTEDGHIVYKCLNGEPEAFGFLVDKYKGAIYAFAYAKLRNFHDAEDVTQEVFIKAYQKLRALRRWDNVLAWLYSITSNMCKNWIRSRASRPDREFVEDQSSGALARPSVNSYLEGVTRESLLESLQEALDLLPEIYSQVLTLYYLAGMSNKEIARFLGTSPDTVRQRLTRARAQLKEEMLASIDTTFEEQKLRVDFTFRIVEAVKWMKIHPTPRTSGLPWGLSLATGLMIAFLSLGPYFGISNQMRATAGSSIPSSMKELKAGEISVDILGVSQTPDVASKNMGGVDGLSPLQGPRAPEKAQIAFSSDRDGNYEIYVMDVDGKNQRRLTNHPANEMHPVWSPDGRRIAFIVSGVGARDWRDWENGWSKSEIYLMDADGKNRINLTNHPADDSSPDWAPDCRRIAFQSYRDGNYEIHVMDANGRNLRNLTNHPAEDQEPDWSPDGQSIAFQSYRDGNYEIYVMDIDGGNLRRLTDHPGLDTLPVWSPDGQRIGFISNRDGNYEIYVMDADGSNQSNLTNHPARDWEPGWSPDGQSITFVSNRDGEWDVYVMNADGQNVRNLTNDSASNERPDWFDPASVYDAVSSDGKLNGTWGAVKKGAHTKEQ